MIYRGYVSYVNYCQDGPYQGTIEGGHRGSLVWEFSVVPNIVP